jgi:hypothetical protein
VAQTGLIFDTVAPAASAVALTLQVLLDPVRAARMARSGAPGFGTVCDKLLDATWRVKPAAGLAGVIQRQTNLQVLYGLLRLALDTTVDVHARTVALDVLAGLDRWLSRQSPRDTAIRAHYDFARFEMERLRRDPAQLEIIANVVVPPGSPIGSNETSRR